MSRSSALLELQTRCSCGCRRTLLEIYMSLFGCSPEIYWPPRLGKSLAFTIGTTALFFTGSSLISYENREAACLKRRICPVRAWYDQFSLVKWWKAQTPGKKLFCGILAVNGIVFSMWQIPRLSIFMMKNFVTFPTSNRVSPMLLSVFSHWSAFHLAMNMTLLYSFIDSAVNLMGVPHFLAFYLSGGVIASQASIIRKLFTKDWSGSLGASGAICAVIALICMTYPDSRLRSRFLPEVNRTGSFWIKQIVATETFALLWLSGLSVEDHAAHLGGLLFGIGYCLGGNKLYTMYDRALLQYWHRIRSSRKDR